MIHFKCSLVFGVFFHTRNKLFWRKSCVLTRGGSKKKNACVISVVIHLTLWHTHAGLGSSSSSHWDLLGNAMITPEYVRLTPDLQSRQGAVWSRIVSTLRIECSHSNTPCHAVLENNQRQDSVMKWGYSYQHEFDDFSGTAHFDVFYFSYTAATCQ